MWEKRVERWKDSGLAAKEFAAETGINVSSHFDNVGWETPVRIDSWPAVWAFGASIFATILS